MGINRLQVITLYVNDQDAAEAFFVDALGFEKRTDVDMGKFRWLEVAPPGAETSIALSLPFLGKKVIPGPTGFMFDVTDVRGLVQELDAKGVKVTQEPHEQPWGGIEARVVDADGHEFALIERKS